MFSVSVCRIMGKLPARFSCYLVEGCSMGQESSDMKWSSALVEVCALPTALLDAFIFFPIMCFRRVFYFDSSCRKSSCPWWRPWLQPADHPPSSGSFQRYIHRPYDRASPRCRRQWLHLKNTHRSWIYIWFGEFFLIFSNRISHQQLAQSVDVQEAEFMQEILTWPTPAPCHSHQQWIRMRI